MDRKIYKLLRHLQVEMEDMCARMDDLEELLLELEWEEEDEEEYECEEEDEPEKAA